MSNHHEYTGLSRRKLYLMRRFLRRLRWWGPRCPSSDDVDKIWSNRRIIRALGSRPHRPRTE